MWIVRWIADWSHMSRGVGHRWAMGWITDGAQSESRIDLIRVAHGTQDRLQMYHVWVTGWVTNGSHNVTCGSQMSRKWVTYESRIGHTLVTLLNTTFLIFFSKTYPSLTSSQLGHTSDTKNKCNFRSIRRK